MDILSCIICSRKRDISLELRHNITSTIGVEHEIIVIDNSHSEYTIFSAYNEGISRAKGDYLIFMHDDILYSSKGWGGLFYAILMTK